MRYGEKKDQSLRISVTKELLDQLDKLADEQRRTRSGMVRVLLEQAVEYVVNPQAES